MKVARKAELTAGLSAVSWWVLWMASQLGRQSAHAWACGWGFLLAASLVYQLELSSVWLLE